jgi:dihydroorotate dehydrogenase
MEFEKKLRELNEYYLENPIDEKFPEIVKDQLGIDLRAKYGNFILTHPVLVAPGQLTREKWQIERIKKAGYSGCVLKSLVGEDENGNCSMIEYRKKMTYLKTVYEEFDKEGAFPVIIWDGRADNRSMEEYLNFAKDVFNFNDSNFLIVASILCHLPEPGEKFKEEEWIYTTKKLYEIGYRIFEIDFCPGLKNEKEIVMKENILRIYREIPQIIKKISSEISVFPKILNLDYGIDFQVKIVEEAIKGKSDGVIIGNRIFRKDINSAWGGSILRERNLKVIKEVKRAFPDFSISGTGGIYTGRDILNYLRAGSDNVQILSYILGKVKKPFIKQKGDKFEKVLYELFFNPENGFLVSFYK